MVRSRGRLPRTIEDMGLLLLGDPLVFKEPGDILFKPFASKMNDRNSPAARHILRLGQL